MSESHQHRYVLTAVVIVPSDERVPEDSFAASLKAVLRDAGYLVKWADAREVRDETAWVTGGGA